MPSAETSQHQVADGQRQPPIQCEACEAALHATGTQTVSFLLVDHLTAPLVGCEDHLEQFATVCGLTTDATAELIEHHPAGGITCPNCHLTLQTPEQPVIPVQDGAVAPLVCPEHQAAIMSRFHTGLDLQHQLTASLDTTQ